MTAGHQVREFKDLPLDALRRPDLDARLDRDPEKLQELADDIRRRGVIFPLVVFPAGDAYEIVDGFRRYLAARQAGVVFVTCCVYPTKDVALEGIKYAANAFREDMSPADEAIFFNELLKGECAGDIEKVGLLVNRKITYVDNRLALLNGAEDVFEALRARKISIGVAGELNKIDDARYRSHYLHHAIEGGSTVGVVSAWVTEWKILFGDAKQLPTSPIAEMGSGTGSVYDPMRCYLCKKSTPRFIPESVSIHTHCRLAILDPILEQARGGSDDELVEPDPRRV